MLSIGGVLWDEGDGGHAIAPPGAPMTTVLNPVLPGFHPDPSVCRVGEDYYLVTSTFEWFPGIPVYHSRDLVNWRPIGHVLNRESQIDLEGAPTSRGIWAAVIRYQAGKFYVISTNMNKAGTLRKFIWTATDPAGPWSEPIPVDQMGVDPSLYWASNGKVYVTGNGRPPGKTLGIYQAEIDPDTGTLLSENRRICEGSGDAHVEAPHLFERGGWWYLSMAEGGCQMRHIQTFFRSRDPYGPWEPCPRNPVLTHRRYGASSIHGLGHADFIEDQHGRWWCFFLAYRLTQVFFNHLGRETFLAPMTWDADGWPVIGNNGTIEPEMEMDTLPIHTWPKPPVRDDFDGPTLDVRWIMLRVPVGDRFDLAARPGWLTIRGNRWSLDDEHNPAILARRQEDWDCTVSIAIEAEPLQAGHEAGLTVFLCHDHHYELAIVRDQCRRRRLLLRRRIADLQAVVASTDLPDGLLVLGVEADKFLYRFWWQGADGVRHPLGTGSTQGLSAEAAKLNFTGVVVGPYAVGEGMVAAIDWFEYRGTPWAGKNIGSTAPG